MKSYAERLHSELALLWAPPPDLTVSEWAQNYRFLSSEASAQPGKWRNEAIPFAKDIFDACHEPGVDSVAVMCAAQMVKTEFLLNVLGYFIHLDPCPIMMVQPTIDMAESVSQERVAPMIRDSPVLTGLVAPPKSKGSGNTILKKSFPGGQVILSGANSPASLASRPIRLLVCDEIDRWPSSLGDEGDPLRLAEKRTDSFYNRLRIYVSTPTRKGASRIEAVIENSDKRVCLVPCPHCGHMQQFIWANLKWEKTAEGKHLPETAAYQCSECGELIDEKYKKKMLQGYQWVKTDPGRRIAGFHQLNALYSPWARWSSLVEAWIEAQDRPELLKTFVNLNLGECWEEQSEEMADAGLSILAENFSRTSPLADTLIYTAGVDVQADRLECTVVGWNIGQALQVYETFVVSGDTAVEPEPVGKEDTTSRNPYKKLAALLLDRYGDKLPLGCIDCGFNTEWVFRNRARYLPRFVATKGDAGPAKASVTDERYSGSHKSPYRVIGVDGYKDALQARLGANNESIRFSNTLPSEWYDQLLAERVFVGRKKGFASREWRAIRKRNEALDCVVMAWAALYILNPDWGILGAPKTPDEKPKKHSNFATDWR